MKKSIATILAMLLLILSSCSSDSSARVTTQPEDTAFDGDDTVVVTVSCIYESAIDDKIAFFESIYPNIKISVTNYQNNTQSYYEQLQIKLMTNAADDVFEVAWLPYFEYVDKGLLVNIYDLMDDDDKYNKDDFFRNILAAMEYNGGLYAYPKSFSMEFIAINNNVPDSLLQAYTSLDSIDYETLVEMYRASGFDGELCLEPEFSLKSKVYQFMVEFVDFENKTCDFNNPRFINILKNFRAAAEQGKEDIISLTGGARYTHSDNDLSTKYMFRKIYYNEYNYFVEYDSSVYTHVIPITSSDGKIMIYPHNPYAIYQGSKNEEAAWEYVKYLASRILISRHPSDIPLNSTIFDRNIFSNIQRVILNNELRDISGQYAIDGNIFRRMDSVVALMTEVVNMPARLRFPAYEGLDLVLGEIDLFLNDFITAEQAAANIQNKMSIKLAE